MVKFKKGLIVLTISASIFTGAIAGCLAPRKPAPSTPTPPSQTIPGPARKPIVNMSQISKNAVKEAESVSGVTKATAATTGKMVYVGINIKGSQATTRVDGIKRDVANKIKKSNTGITSVIVTSDPKLVTKIRRISDGISKGKPVSSFSREFADLSKRISPTIR